VKGVEVPSTGHEQGYEHFAPVGIAGCPDMPAA
jgi:hypothetical protein